MEVNQSASSGTECNYRYLGLTRAELALDIANFWTVVLEHITSTRKNGTWSRIVFECWPEKGCVIAYPQKRGDAPDCHMPEIVGHFEYMYTFIVKALEAKSEQERGWAFDLAYSNVTCLIIVGYQKDPALRIIKDVQKENDFKIRIMRNNDSKISGDFEVFFR